MRQAFGFILSLFLLVVTGCASTATGSSQTALVLPAGSDAFLQTVPKPSDALVVIRYPSVIDDDALSLFSTAFANRPIGGLTSSANVSAADTERLAESLVSKSNFFVMSLYDRLRMQLPAGSVVLSPHIIQLGDNSRLTSTPLMEAEELPAVLTVDFMPYSFPDGEQMMNAPPLTFGDLFSPLLTVRTDYRASPGTFGVLMASAPLVGTAYEEARQQTLAEMAALASASPDLEQIRAPQRHTFVAYLDSVRSNSAPRGILAHTARVETIQSIPMEKLQLPGGVMARMAAAPSEVTDPIGLRYADPAASRIIGLLNRLDYGRATFVTQMSAIATYDAELGDLYLNAAYDPAVEERLLFADRLLEAEKDYISARSDALFFGAVESDRGAVMREIIAAEWDALQQRRELAAQQNAATALAILAVAGAVAASTSDDPNVSQGVGSVAIAGAVLATTSALSKRTQSQAIGVNSRQALATAFDEQISVQLNLITGTEEISAASFVEFRDRLTEIYADQITGIGSTAGTCQFGESGIWTGPCENGLGTGRGRGVFQTDDGAIFEYYGDADRGVPDGTGLLLVASNGGLQGFEGAFVDGQLNGLAIVHRAGRAPASQTFVNGQSQPGTVQTQPPRLFGPVSDAVG